MSVLNLSQSVDDTVWATAARGTLFATDSNSNNVFAVRGRFAVATAFTSATPGNKTDKRGIAAAIALPS